jgi:hypothetical protein
VDDNGVPFSLFLRFDGVDDGMQTNSINFTATDKVTVWAGVRKLSDDARGVVVEHNNGSVGSNRTFSVDTPTTSIFAGASSPFANFSAAVHGSGSQEAGDYAVYSTPNTYPSPQSVVLSVGFDIELKSVESTKLRLNGTAPTRAAATFTGATMSGNFVDAPLYIGRRGGTTLPFNGRLHSLIVRGAQSTTQQIEQTEAYVNARTKAF